MRKLTPQTIDKIKRAHAIVGNQQRYALRNMVKALSFHTWLNTPQDTERLNAAKIVLRHWSTVQKMGV